MKFIKRFNESKEEDIKEYLEDICRDFSDDGLIVDIKIHRNVTFYACFIKSHKHKHTFNLKKYIPAIESMSLYMASVGCKMFDFNVNLSYHGDVSININKWQEIINHNAHQIEETNSILIKFKEC